MDMSDLLTLVLMLLGVAVIGFVMWRYCIPPRGLIAVIGLSSTWQARSTSCPRRDLVQHFVDHDLLGLAPSKLPCLKFGQGGLLPLIGGLIGLGL
jgi:hypothetical protein